MCNVILQKINKASSIPTKKQFKTWIAQVLPASKKNFEIVIRVVDTKEITQINKKYRKKNKPTNIISFPFEQLPGIKTSILGDLIICAPLVKEEAKLQNKIIKDHWAHLVIHGVLHLLGHDHENDTEADQMERLEIKLLKKLGIANPYEPIS